MIKMIWRAVLTAALVVVSFAFDTLLWIVKKMKGYVIFPGG